MNALYDVDGFHFSHVMQDTLRGLNSGPASHLLGGVLEIIVGRYRQRSVQKLWNVFDEWCKQNRIINPVPPFTAGMINMVTKNTTSAKCPEGKCKALNCKHVCSWFAFYT